MKCRDGAAVAPAGQLQAPQLVVADRQPRGLGRRSAGGAISSRRSCSAMASSQLRASMARSRSATQRLGVVGPALQHVAIERARLVEPAGPPSLARAAHGVPGLRIVVRHLRRRPGPAASVGELTPEREQRAERGIHGATSDGRRGRDGASAGGGALFFFDQRWQSMQ